MIRYRYKGARLLFVGINPHHGSFARGIPFSNSKLFWYLLSDAGILPEPRSELRSDEGLRTAYRTRFGAGAGLGFVNMIDRPTRGIAELARGEEARGRARLRRIVRQEEPLVVCFVGKAPYQRFIGATAAEYGWQPLLRGSRVFVMHVPQHGLAAVRVRELRVVARAAGIPLA
ncbi:MAG TPA: mismatch-specific DNA-glycosylase [Candidatus Paceibacterota bacterium]|nr:mismatch-specific DNA-glycosylase [Candidatus Paceibacterota bacterium]